tara:strand:- start:399 stop:1187 length:789 start_codon:yes stop_codon:yes gene_type:complete
MKTTGFVHLLQSFVSEDKLMTSKDWCDFCKVVVLDPDGWDRTNYKHSFEVEKINLTDFAVRLSDSTVSWSKFSSMLDIVEFGTNFKDVCKDKFCFFWHWGGDGEHVLDIDDGVKDHPLYISDEVHTWHTRTYPGEQVLYLIIAWVTKPKLIIACDKDYETELYDSKELTDGDHDSYFYTPANTDTSYRQGRLLEPTRQVVDVVKVFSTHTGIATEKHFGQDNYTVTFTNEEVKEGNHDSDYRLISSRVMADGKTWQTLYYHE